ncbi:MAG: bifunctional adenosylcobinamide kinase/adenosylcobinamide-phosphate guanylyltransferase [Pseudomonadota bacterium]|nr:bifunctional adenosylcobinamide kinase/adenosylcobinamide-phosphate guanylyltransferase [Pseudomonadota bacterium]MEE3101794.1 bifunctional adenosylcobinamide kinase/adenosylcobinamide-phosphate guanylyltransferase [Pseudomonadota bacterium]
MTDTLARHALILGGARSGKTRAALDWAASLGPARIYVATAEPGDAEMADRIARHRAERGAGWRTEEVPLDLAPALTGLGASETGADAVLVDCLTLWLSNLLMAGRDPEAETGVLIDALASVRVPTLLVSNEIGMGLVPDTPLGRSFRDAQGRLNQRVAAAVGHAVFVAAGLPLRLKGEGRYFP